MKILSINRSSKGGQIQVGRKPVDTGIFKQPVQSSVRVNKLGIEGDFIADLKHHGGPDQAVYLYSLEDYHWWQKKLSTPIATGTFGENILLSSLGVPVDKIRPGDRYRIGDSVVLEVTSARVPCAKLGVVMGDSMFVKQFIEGQRPGIYTRVINEGVIGLDSEISYQPTTHNYPGVMELFNLFHSKQKDADLIRRLLASPIDARGKGYLKDMLSKL